MTLVNIIGIFLKDGQVCTYYNFATNGTNYESGHILELPRNGENCIVVVLGMHGMIILFMVLLLK